VRRLDRVQVTEVAAVPADRVWQLLATPACWPAWAPHMAHVTDRSGGAPGPVQVGQALRIHARVPGLVVPVEVTDVRDGVSWEMVAGTPIGRVGASHLVVDGGDRTALTVTLTWLGPALLGPALLGPALLGAYRPLAALSLRRLLQLAAAEARGAAVASRRRCEPCPPPDQTA
jgi:hypothetical protein